MQLLFALLAAALVSSKGQERTSRARLQELQGRLGVAKRSHLRGLAAKMKYSYDWLLQYFDREIDGWVPINEFSEHVPKLGPREGTLSSVLASAFFFAITRSGRGIPESVAPKLKFRMIVVSIARGISAPKKLDVITSKDWASKLSGAESELTSYIPWLAREYARKIVAIDRTAMKIRREEFWSMRDIPRPENEFQFTSELLRLVLLEDVKVKPAPPILPDEGGSEWDSRMTQSSYWEHHLYRYDRPEVIIPKGAVVKFVRMLRWSPSQTPRATLLVEIDGSYFSSGFDQYATIPWGSMMDPRDEHREAMQRALFTARAVLNGFRESILDWVREEQPDLTRYTYEEAKEAAERWHQSFISDVESGGPVPPRLEMIRFPDGASITRLVTKNDFSAESGSMDHCIGASGGGTHYWKSSRDGTGAAYSYENPEGVPQVTVMLDDINKGNVTIYDAEGPGNEAPTDKLGASRMVAFISGLVDPDVGENDYWLYRMLGGVADSDDLSGLSDNISETRAEFMNTADKINEFDPEFDESELIEEMQELRDEMKDLDDYDDEEELRDAQERYDDLEMQWNALGDNKSLKEEFEADLDNYFTVVKSAIEEIEESLGQKWKVRDTSRARGIAEPGLYVTLPNGDILESEMKYPGFGDYPEEVSWSFRSGDEDHDFIGLLVRVYGNSDGDLLPVENPPGTSLTSIEKAAEIHRDTMTWLPLMESAQDETTGRNLSIETTDKFLADHGLGLKKGRLHPTSDRGKDVLYRMQEPG